MQSDLTDLPPITVVLWTEFQQDPSVLYNLCEHTVRPGDLFYHSDNVVDMTGAYFNRKLSEFRVNSTTELHTLTNELLNKPVLFRTKIRHEKYENVICVTVRKKWSDEFVVLVNTRHPQIRDMLSIQLSEVMQLMQEGKNFCLHLMFGSCVRKWYGNMVDGVNHICSTEIDTDSCHMNIWITNCKKPNLYCLNPICICCCFPLWLILGGPCYMINRRMTCKDLSYSFEDMQVVYISKDNRSLKLTKNQN